MIGCHLYLLDVGTDAYSAYRFKYNPPHNITREGAKRIGDAILAFILLPFIVTAIATISSVLRDINKKILSKLMYIPAIITGSPPCLPFYHIAKAAPGLFCGIDPDGSIANVAGFFKLIEALLESYPQAVIQLYLIAGSGVEWWQYTSLAISLLKPQSHWP